MDKLTPKQEQFCLEYLIDLNGSQAAVRAGYSKKTAREQAARMLSKVNIQERITFLRAQREHRTQITIDRVLKEIAHLAFSNLSDFVDADGNLIVNLNDLTREQCAAISQMDIIEDSDGGKKIKIKLADKPRSLEMLMKHLQGFAPTQVELSGSVATTAPVTGIPYNQLLEAINEPSDQS